jgi:putative nucleotidyltransferase with HDIG domain
MKLPSREECFKFLEKYEVPENILEHSKMVNKVADYVAKKLKEVGAKIDLDVVDRATLLHDIGKYIEIKEAKLPKVDNHHIIGEEILAKEGYPELGKVVRRHSLKEMKNITTWEEKVVKYSDLRVKHAELVSTRHRLDDLNIRYDVPDNERVDELKVFALEKEIFDKIKENPDILRKVIK